MIYFVESIETDEIKIGFTKDKNMERRLRALQSYSSSTLRVYAVAEGDSDKEVHMIFANHRVHGEWFEACEEVYQLIDQFIQERPIRKRRTFDQLLEDFQFYGKSKENQLKELKMMEAMGIGTEEDRKRVREAIE
jgi:hypothetical protein